MNLQSTASIAKIGTKSLRATIPEGIVAYLEILAGDKLDWKMEIKNGEKIIIVKKADLINKNTAKIGYRYRTKTTK